MTATAIANIDRRRIGNGILFDDLLKNCLFDLRHIWRNDRTKVELEVLQDADFDCDEKCLSLLLKQLLINASNSQNPCENDAYVRLTVRVLEGMAFVKLVQNESSELGIQFGAERGKVLRITEKTQYPASYIAAELAEYLGASIGSEVNKNSERIITLLIPHN